MTSAGKEFKHLAELPVSLLTGGKGKFREEMLNAAQFLKNMANDPRVEGLCRKYKWHSVAEISKDLKNLSNTLGAIIKVNSFPHTPQLDEVFKKGIIAMQESTALIEALWYSDGVDSRALATDTKVETFKRETAELADSLQALVDKHFHPLTPKQKRRI